MSGAAGGIGGNDGATLPNGLAPAAVKGFASVAEEDELPNGLAPAAVAVDTDTGAVEPFAPVEAIPLLVPN